MLINSDFLGRGWSFPIRASSSASVQWSAGDDKIRESILLILRTVPGERVLMPAFGCRIGELAFSPNDGATRALARTFVQEALARWEPRIDLPAVTIDGSTSAPNLMPISVDYVVKETNRSANLVYPFYLK